jgi:hypothetical protein
MSGEHGRIVLRAPNKWLPMSSGEAGKKLTF